MTSVFLKSQLRPCFQVDVFVLHSSNSGKTKRVAYNYSFMLSLLWSMFSLEEVAHVLHKEIMMVTFCNRPSIAERMFGKIWLLLQSLESGCHSGLLNDTVHLDCFGVHWQSFGNINCRDVYLLSSRRELHGTSLVVNKAPNIHFMTQ